MNSIFENLFVLELANNHWGSLDRGMELAKEPIWQQRINPKSNQNSLHKIFLKFF